jgi:hypothetical protein
MPRIYKPLSEETKQKISETKKKQHIIPRSAFKKGVTSWNKGKPAPWVVERNKSNNPGIVGTKHHFWKGEFTSYRNMHRWVVRLKGQPTQCENCKTDKLTGHQIHWANVDHQYRRDTNDYIRLCAKCHKSYDKKLK